MRGGPSDAGRASYQIAVNVCSHCGGGSIQGAGEAIDVAPEVVAMACCDAQHLGDVSSAHVGARVRAKQEIPPATRRLVERRDGGRCVVPGCRSSVWVDIHHIDPRADERCRQASPTLADRSTKVFEETESRRAIAEARAHVGPAAG